MIEKKTAKEYVAKLRKNSQGKYVNVSTTDANVKYFIADLLDKTATQGYGIQTRRIVTCIFIGTMMGDAMLEDVTALAANPEFNGELPKSMFGNFYDVPLGGRYKSSFTPAGQTTPVTVELSTISVFIADGDSPASVAIRAVKNFKNNPANELIDEGNTEQTDSAAEAAILAAASTAGTL